MGRWLFTIFVLGASGYASYYASTYFLRVAMHNRMPYELTRLGATPENVGIGFGIVLGIMCGVWTWSWTSNLKQ
jgi:hypothetical protein